MPQFYDIYTVLSHLNELCRINALLVLCNIGVASGTDAFLPFTVGYGG